MTIATLPRKADVKLVGTSPVERNAERVLIPVHILRTASAYESTVILHIGRATRIGTQADLCAGTAVDRIWKGSAVPRANVVFARSDASLTEPNLWKGRVHIGGAGIHIGVHIVAARVGSLYQRAVASTMLRITRAHRAARVPVGARACFDLRRVALRRRIRPGVLHSNRRARAARDQHQHSYRSAHGGEA